MRIPSAFGGRYLAGLCPRVGELDRHERLRGRVAVLGVLKDQSAERVLALCGHVGEELTVALDTKTRQPAFKSPSASQVNLLLWTHTLVGAGGGVGSVTLVIVFHPRLTP